MWAPTDSNSNTIRFSFRLAFRRSSRFCDQNTISESALIRVGSWKAKCISASNSRCNSSEITVGTADFFCTDYSTSEDWTMGGNTFTYTFPSTSKEWSVSFSDCCWIPLSRGGSNWLVSTNVNLARRSDNGKINSSPVSRSAAIVRFREGCPRSLRIPVEDPDGDVVKCRHSTYSESEFDDDSFPYGVLDEESCVITFEGGSRTAGTYAVALTLEDFPAGTTDFSNVKPFSAVGLQFLAIISSHSGSCNDTPVFTGSTPQDGDCFEVQVGSVFTAVIQASASALSKQIAEIVTSSPAGMQLTTLSNRGGIYQRNVTWYPNQQQQGQQVFCFKAVDSAGLGTEQRCVTILVGRSNTPRVITGSHSPRPLNSTREPGLFQLSIKFDRVIKKPRTSSYIRLVLLPSGDTVYKVDTLSQDVEISSNGTVLYFKMPKAAFSMSGSYAIMIDKGAVVGKGCAYDGPPTPGMQSLSDWQFYSEGVCPFGYYQDPTKSTSCVDINECETPSRSTSATAANLSNALESPLYFEFHIPADCDHVCINSPGGYSCACHSGYELDSDKKTCIDTDECSSRNVGCSHQCVNVPGSFYCECPGGILMNSNNLTCDEPSRLTCTRDNMTMTLQKETYYFFDVSQLHLRYGSCRATENSTHFIISTPLDGCGTLVNETEHALIFWNEVQADAFIIDNVITRTHNLKLPFSCSYSRNTLQSLGFTPQSIFLGYEAGYGNFTFKMDFYDSPSFSTAYTQRDYPLEMPLDDYVYLGYSVESSADLVIMAANCKATKDGSFYSWPQYTFMENGCSRDTTLDYSYDPTRSFQHLKIKTFRFFNDYDPIFVHCELFACHKTFTDSRCSKGCLSSDKRKRRDVTRDHIGLEERTSKVILTRGPLLMKEKEIQASNREDPGHDKHTALIGGIAAVGGFGLVAVIALTALGVKYRMAVAKRFMNVTYV